MINTLLEEEKEVRKFLEEIIMDKTLKKYLVIYLEIIILEERIGIIKVERIQGKYLEELTLRYSKT